MRIPALDDRCLYMVVYCLTIIYHFVKFIKGSMYQCYIYHIFTHVYIETIYDIHYTICIIQYTLYNIQYAIYMCSLSMVLTGFSQSTMVVAIAQFPRTAS